MFFFPFRWIIGCLLFKLISFKKWYFFLLQLTIINIIYLIIFCHSKWQLYATGIKKATSKTEFQFLYDLLITWPTYHLYFSLHFDWCHNNVVFVQEYKWSILFQKRVFEIWFNLAKMFWKMYIYIIHSISKNKHKIDYAGCLDNCLYTLS
jgi:hypothetical protein